MLFVLWLSLEMLADHISNYGVAYINKGDISTYPFAKC